MNADAATKLDASPDLDEDIVFSCSECGTSLVVDQAAVGLTLNCQQCGKPIIVPHKASSPVNGELADLQRRLRENESQRVEITSYINQHSIQLHRWQLQLKTLDQRKAELLKDLSRLS
jgi:DNA-directed RNA polymerase subunit RPC12/RpoP